MLICSPNNFYTGKKSRRILCWFKFVDIKKFLTTLQKRCEIHFSTFKIVLKYRSRFNVCINYVFLHGTTQTMDRIYWIYPPRHQYACIPFSLHATVFLLTKIIPGVHDMSIYNTRGTSSLFSCDTCVQLNRTKICNSSLWQNFHLFRRKLYVWLAWK